MTQPELDFASYADPPTGWATSLANVAEVMIPCIDATGAKSVGEVGAYAGDLTRLLADWAAVTGGKVLAIDPSPKPALLKLANERAELQLIRETSIDALPHIDLPDVLIIDGDHNYWTVSQELRLVAERALDPGMPLLMFHDVGWPHAFRDDYFEIELIPEEYRHPVAGADRSRGLHPDDTGLRRGGLPYPRSAAREGGERNGVRAAVEDFVAGHHALRFARVPAFFGFGVVWHEDAPWADQVADHLRPWDSNPVLERLESNRLHHLVEIQAIKNEIQRLRERQDPQEAVLRRLLNSSAFGLAERLSRLRDRIGVGKAATIVSKEEVRRALGD